MPSQPPRPSNGGTAVRKAVAGLEPWQRRLLFSVGAVAFLLPILDHLVNEIIRGQTGNMTLLHVINDGTFLFAGVLGMIPPIALRIADKLLSWKR
jgi:hypothetical protein